VPDFSPEETEDTEEPEMFEDAEIEEVLQQETAGESAENKETKVDMVH
jgi:hypothetical protein